MQQLPGGVTVSNGGTLYSGHRNFTIASNSKIRVGYYAILDANCHEVSGAVVGRVTKAPEHGKVSIFRTVELPNPPLVTTAPNAHCMYQPRPGMAVYYQSAGNYVGTDTFTYEAYMPAGIAAHADITINIQ